MAELAEDTVSVMQARWRMPDAPMDAIEQLARKHNLPEIIARILCTREIPADQIEAFLKPTLARDFPDPFALLGMQETAEYLADAIQAQKNIFIFGDFDVDGATSSAIMARFLRHFGLEAPIYIPGRLTEGYGPNEEAFKSFKEQGANIVILLDCGTTAFDPVKAGREFGLEILILDHHEAEENLPAANHIVNPKRSGDTSGFSMLAACGVTFLTCIAVNKVLRERGYFKNGLAEPQLKDQLDLVALGTVCDMVPLTGPNRLFVRYGFAQMHETKNIGLKALIDTAALKGPITTYHAGFVLGPRINAGSRVHKSELGAQLLSTNDAEEAGSIAWTLHDCNEKRKEIQAEMERAAIDKVAALGLDQNPVIIVDDEKFHAGLTGLVAGKIKDKYGKPACVISYADNPQGLREGRGSGRSMPGIHIAHAFIDARVAGLIEKGGGHAMAGGFTILPEKLEAFGKFMNDHIAAQAMNAGKNVETLIEGILTVRGARADLVKILQEHLGPFGQEQPEPLFLFKNVRIHMADIVGANHVRVTIGDQEGGMNIKAVAFKALGTPLGDALMKQGPHLMHICGHLKLDTWQGRERVEMHIRDAAFAFPEQKRQAS